MNILRNIYVDNIITGVESEEQALHFYQTTKKLFESTSMNIHEWMSNSTNALSSIQPADRARGKFKILGIPWNAKDDTFSIITPQLSSLNNTITKWSTLQYLASFFDPLGVMCPALLQGKIFIQSLWKQKLDWDTPLTSELASEWRRIAAELPIIKDFSFPHFVGNGGCYELHCFCDASQSAYRIAIYLRIITVHTIEVQLIFAKNRLAPLHGTMTIPRLELMAIHTGSRCLSFVSSALPFVVTQQTIWMDSECVLHWLKSEKSLTTFVKNRVNEIKDQCPASFRYVSTEQNPADPASRGVTASKLIGSQLWWHSPKFLTYRNEEEWPKSSHYHPPSVPSLAQSEESTTCLITTGRAQESPHNIGEIIDPQKFSSLMRLLRVTAWCLRVCSAKKPNAQELTSDEIAKAKLVWLRYIQYRKFSYVFEAFQSKKQHPLIHEFSLWIDKNGLLQCGGRLSHSNHTELTIHPILLPKNDHFTMLIVHSYHHTLYHAGVSHTLASIRQEYWILAGHSMVFKYIRSCLKCQRYDGGPYRAPLMPALPTPWVTPHAPFTVTGLDYLGPLIIKEPAMGKGKTKVWVCLFTCLTTRAIHLELVPSLSAEQFLLCLHRFCNHRGVPSMIISDNAPHFKLVKKVLDKLWDTAIHDPSVVSYVANQGIRWTFITERAPWMGGFYERLVRLVKQSLRKSLGHLCLTGIQLQTILIEIEAILNTRLLVYVGADFDAGYCLTPAHFLMQNRNTGMPSIPFGNDPDPDYITKLSSPQVLLETWKKGQKHLEQFWRSWRNDYLLSLRERSQSALKEPHCLAPHPPHIGDIVHVKTDGPRGTWKIGQVAALVPSSDGLVRSLKIRLSDGKYLTCSVTHIYPLECNNQAESISLSNQNDAAKSPSVNLEVSQTPQPTRRLRKAAQTACTCIQHIANNERDSSSDDDDMESSPPTQPHTSLLTVTNHSNQNSSQPIRPGRTLAITFCLLVCCLAQGEALTPLLCQSQEAKIILDLSTTIDLPTDVMDVYSGIVQLFKRNIAKYESAAYWCKKVKTIKSAWTGFAKTGWDHSAKEIEIDVTEQECFNMIQSHRCSEGPLLGSDSLAFMENNVKYPYSTGNAWDCCEWHMKEVINCFLTKGKVYQTFGGLMESNLGNVASCGYDKKMCILPDKSMLTWEPVKEAQCEFIEWKRFASTYWGGRFLSADQEIALTWNPDTTAEVKLCNGESGKLTDQGIPIVYSFTQTRSQRFAHKEDIDHVYQILQQQEQTVQQEPTDFMAARLQALEERLHDLFIHGLNSAFGQICKSIQRMQQINLILAHSEPTLIARHILNEPHVMAKLNGKLLEVWPCTPIESY